jgi:hypothetical protein
MLPAKRPTGDAAYRKGAKDLIKTKEAELNRLNKSAKGTDGIYKPL